MSPHSPTPWYSILSKQTPYIYIDAADGFHVALMPNPLREGVANAGRIVNCVNACEALEHPGKLPELIERLRAHVKNESERATGAQMQFSAGDILDALGVSS